MWELPMTFRRGMRVPVRIYVSENMLNQIFKDKSIFQAANVATLPGIQKYALVMPDMHEGYASPIGGVAAVSTENGVISPGMQGYDINCLHPDSLISLPFGTYSSVKALGDNWQNAELPLIDKKLKKLEYGKIIYFFSRQERRQLYRLKTKSGCCLRVTGDHPVCINGLMKKAENVGIGDQVIVYPFKGVNYEKPVNSELVNKQRILRIFSRLNLSNSGNRYSQILNWLGKRGLLNLTLDSWQTPYLAKIIGYILGDGSLHLYGKNKSARTAFYGKNEDLERIRVDLDKLGVKATIVTRQRFHQLTSAYGKVYSFRFVEHCLSTGSVGFAVLLHALGVPFGNKTYQRFEVPLWLFRAALWQKRLFLASFFGAEMSKPATLNKFNFYAPTININKEISLSGNGIKFLNQIRYLLKELGVSSGRIAEVTELGYRGRTIGLRFGISGKSGNLIRFFETVGFEYHREKHRLACLATSYLRRKLAVVKLREETRKLVKNLYASGVSVRELAKNYTRQFMGQNFIEHSAWSNRKGPRIAFDFYSFDDFVKSHCFGGDGFVLDEIEEASKEDYCGQVYDLTVNDLNHNFIADSFVVSNCGVRLLKSGVSEEEIKPFLSKLTDEIYKQVPSGLGQGRQIKLSNTEIDHILEGGAKYLVEKGFGERQDLENCEGNGRLPWAKASAVSSQAKNRGRDQVGTLGSGNHFLELQKVTEIFDEGIAKAFGLFLGQTVIMIHCGSRGLGHQVCTDYLKEFIPLMENKYKIPVPDREFACVPFNSLEGQKCLAGSAAAANFAWANRQMISHFVRKSWSNIMGEKAGEITLLYDVAHNIIKKEKYFVDEKEIETAVHRKGATRAFPPGHSEIPERYRAFGQPVLIPGSMGSASYVLVGTIAGQESFYSTAHGAGRTMSRHQAMRETSGEQVIRELKSKGIIVKCQSLRGIAEEAPLAYKDIDEVVEVVHQAGLSKKVAKMIPLAVIKGE